MNTLYCNTAPQSRQDRRILPRIHCGEPTTVQGLFGIESSIRGVPSHPWGELLDLNSFCKQPAALRWTYTDVSDAVSSCAGYSGISCQDVFHSNEFSSPCRSPGGGLSLSPPTPARIARLVTRPDPAPGAAALVIRPTLSGLESLFKSGWCSGTFSKQEYPENTTTHFITRNLQ
ncbi:hypothetical protein AAFF_G00173660 [Aldrovandia affinis]|uniref:Uncharacterized protein n=1 Tax=Aldrovandia affinis TaxID=143900 RepID=A0AAD7WWA1_9TELE|nr:hypothetical protein AAFF_G00173660 [Aldrovandia affinis]